MTGSATRRSASVGIEVAVPDAAERLLGGIPTQRDHLAVGGVEHVDGVSAAGVHAAADHRVVAPDAPLSRRGGVLRVGRRRPDHRHEGGDDSVAFVKILTRSSSCRPCRRWCPVA